MARYVLEPAVETALVRALLAENPGESHDVLAVCIWGGSEYADVARATEARVFMEALGDPWTVLQEDFAGAEDQSWFFLCLDRHAQRPTGALRVVEHGPIGFPFLRHLAEPPHELSQSRLVEGFGLDLGRLWEVGTIAVDPAYRSAAQASTTTALLYRALYAGALANNTSHLASIVVPPTLKKLHSLGIPFERMPGMPMKVFWDGAEYEPVMGILFSRMGFSFTQNRRPAVTWTATDHTWSQGEGPQVRGSMADLTLAAAGHSARLDRLTGDGAELVVAWLR